MLALCAGAGVCRAEDLPPCAGIPAALALPVARSRFLMPANLSYLNVGSLGPTPAAAIDCAVDAWRWLEADKVERYAWSGGATEAARAIAARMLGNVSLDELAHFPSTTAALNAVADGLHGAGFFAPARWADGAAPRALTTDHEHGGGRAAWEHYVARGALAGLDVVALGAPPASADEVVAAFAAAFDRAPPRTYAVVSVSHVLTTTGAALPLARLAGLAHARGALLVVDGAQAAGNVPLDLAATGADAYTVSAHKWLLAPTGSGLLYVRSGGAGAPWIAPTQLDEGFASYTQCTGTTPYQTIAGLGYALKFLEAAGGLDATTRYALDLAARTRANLLAAEPARVRVLSPAPESGLASAFVSFTLTSPACAAGDVAAALKERAGIVVKTLPDNEGGTPLVSNALRVSHHVFNDEDELARFVAELTAALDDVCAARR